MSSENTNAKVTEAFTKSVGRPFAPRLVEVEAHDGRKQTQLVNPENGAIMLAVNKTGDEAVEAFVENAGVPFLDAAFSQPEIDGPNQANQLDKSDNNVRVPAGNPGAAVEADKSDTADKLAEDTAPQRTSAPKTTTKKSSGKKSSKKEK
jgi:hypothetical protein